MLTNEEAGISCSRSCEERSDALQAAVHECWAAVTIGKLPLQRSSGMGRFGQFLWPECVSDHGVGPSLQISVDAKKVCLAIASRLPRDCLAMRRRFVRCRQRVRRGQQDSREFGLSRLDKLDVHGTVQPSAYSAFLPSAEFTRSCHCLISRTAM